MASYIKSVKRGWNLLNWSANAGFTIRIISLNGQWRLRKVTALVPHSETTNESLSISAWETIPWGGIEVWVSHPMKIRYTYLSGETKTLSGEF